MSWKEVLKGGIIRKKGIGTSWLVFKKRRKTKERWENSRRLDCLWNFNNKGGPKPCGRADASKEEKEDVGQLVLYQKLRERRKEEVKNKYYLQKGENMTWKEMLKAHSCRTEKILYGNQKKLDRNKNSKIDAENLAHLRANKSESCRRYENCFYSRKRRRASGLEPLEEATKMSGEELKEMLESMDNVVQHKSGDYILLDGLPLPEDDDDDEDE